MRHDDPLIAEALDTVYVTHPYYARAIQGLRIVSDKNVPTMATSAQWVTHYNPDTLKTWTRSERAAVLVHELEHLLRQHNERCGQRDPQGWNIAGDAEINQRLPGLPDGAIYPETLGMPRGNTAEVYYAANGGQGGKPQPQDGPPQDGSGDGTGRPGGPGQPNCGSSAGGPAQEHERNDAHWPGDGAMGDGKDARKEAAEDIITARLPGTAEGTELREWAERELGIDRAAWYGALASAVGHTMAPYGAPTRWVWPGRRDLRDMGGAMLPRWTGERPSCAVVVDTSSSITPMDLEMARAAGHFIGQMADATYYGCDTYADRYGSEMPEQMRGGGGTDLRVGIEMAIADGAKAVVLITDCGTPWATEPYSVPIIVGANPGAQEVLDGGYGPGYVPPEWMTVLPIMAQGEGDD